MAPTVINGHLLQSPVLIHRLEEVAGSIQKRGPAANLNIYEWPAFAVTKSFWPVFCFLLVATACLSKQVLHQLYSYGCHENILRRHVQRFTSERGVTKTTVCVTPALRSPFFLMRIMASSVAGDCSLKFPPGGPPGIHDAGPDFLRRMPRLEHDCLRSTWNQGIKRLDQSL